MSHDITEDVHMSWADRGRCTSSDPDLFFPRPGADTRYARALCRECAVRQQCLDYALTTGQRHGIWGGMTEVQLRRLRRSRVAHPAAAQPTPGRHLQLVR
jgi:WhiB family redox-sensing transcriptional regulator